MSAGRKIFTQKKILGYIGTVCPTSEIWEKRYVKYQDISGDRDHFYSSLVSLFGFPFLNLCLAIVGHNSETVDRMKYITC